VLDADWSSDDDGVSDYDNPILFAGYYRDAETGLYHVRFRMYHPLVGTWMQRDPLGYVDGRDPRGAIWPRPWDASVDMVMPTVMNLYEAVMSQPLIYVDPFGLSFAEWFLELTGGIDNSSYLDQFGGPGEGWNTAEAAFTIAGGALAGGLTGGASYAPMLTIAGGTAMGIGVEAAKQTETGSAALGTLGPLGGGSAVTSGALAQVATKQPFFAFLGPIGIYSWTVGTVESLQVWEMAEQLVNTLKPKAEKWRSRENELMDEIEGKD